MKKKKFQLVNLTIIFLIFISISFITIGYSALNIELKISGKASITPLENVHISNIELISSNDVTENFTPTITNSTTHIGVNVTSVNSAFTYEVTITNNSSDFYYLNELTEVSNPSGINYFIYDLYKYTEIPPNSDYKFTIVYHHSEVPSNPDIVLTLEYQFLYGEIYKDELLDGSDPVLIDGLIPIVYDETDKKWEKADVINKQWYNYDIGKWANATSVISSMKDHYVTSPPGTTIEMEHMTSMMVWIPRYSYTKKDNYGYQGYEGGALSISTPGAFNIKFGDTTMLDTGSANYTGDYPENYYTSPAFCWGNTCDDPSTRGDSENVEIPGFWVAKFEASKVGTLLHSKPSVTPLNYQTIAQSFFEVQSLMNGINGYENYGYVGFVDAHLLKNTEWGAMAYLSQSKYGKYGNKAYTGIYKEIYPNNCINYITGIGGDAPSVNSTTDTCSVNTYDTYEGMGASTTGNIYGVYDTVGGAFDRVMGTILNVSGLFEPEHSGFTTLPEGRYVNVYPYANYGERATASIKGDALTDTLGYYGDRGVTTTFINYNWFYRGGSLYGDATSINGIFSYTAYTGQADINHASRYAVTIY